MISYLVLVYESLREEHTACIDKSRPVAKLHQLVVCLMEVNHEHPVYQVLDDHRVLLPTSTKEARIGELVQPAGLAATALVSLSLVEEQVMAS